MSDFTEYSPCYFDMEFTDSPEFQSMFDNIVSFDTCVDEITTFDTTMDEVVSIYSSDHSKLTNRELPDQHPIEAITGLEEALNEKQDLLQTLPSGGIVIENNYIKLDDFTLDCGTSTIMI